MLRIIRSLTTWARRFRYRHRYAEIVETLETHFAEKVVLRYWGPMKRSGDQLCQVFRRSGSAEPLAVLRWCPSDEDSLSSDEADLPRQRLPSTARLSLEYNSYQALAPLSLTPTAILLSSDFLLNSWISGTRLADVFRNDPQAVWSWLPRQLHQMKQVHQAGIVHLDANCGNWLVDHEHSQLYLIDFEYTRAPGYSDAELQAFDYVRLLHDLVRPRRAGSVLLKDPRRFGDILSVLIPASAVSSMHRLPDSCFQRLRKDPPLWQQIERLLHREA